MSKLDAEIRQAAAEQALRQKHAKQAENLATVPYQHTSRDPAYYLIEDTDLRHTYGPLIGRIAYSHWWPVENLQTSFVSKIGPYPGGPPDWRIDPLKLALIVRVA